MSGAERLPVTEGSTAGFRIELVAGDEVQDVPEAHVGEALTIADRKHHGIVRQPLLGVEASIERVHEDQRRAAKGPLAKLLRHELESRAAAIGLLQVAYRDLLGQLVHVDGAVAAGPLPRDRAAPRGAGQRLHGGTNLHPDGAEDGKPG